MKKHLLTLAGLVAGATLLLGAAPAMARVNVDVHIGVPGIYVQPAPVYSAWPGYAHPRHVQPHPVYVQPYPVYGPPRMIHYQPPGHWDHGKRWQRGHDDRDDRRGYRRHDRDGDRHSNRRDRRSEHSGRH